MTNYLVNLKEMGQRIKSLRTKQNKTQDFFADMLYISPSYLALIENGKRTATIDVLAQIAKVCDVSVDYLLFGEEEYNSDRTHQKLQRFMETYPKEKVEKAFLLAEFYLNLENNEQK